MVSSKRWVTPSVQGTPYRSLPQLPPPVILWEEEVLPAPRVKPERRVTIRGTAGR